MVGGLVVEVGELGVAVEVLTALGGLGVGLQAVAPLAQQPAGHDIADRVAPVPQCPGQRADRFGGPPQRRHRIAPGHGIDQRLERRNQVLVAILGAFTAATGSTGPTQTRPGSVGSFLATPANRVRRDPARLGDYRDPTRTQLGSLRSQPQPPLKLRQMRSQHRVPPSNRVNQIRHTTKVVPKTAENGITSSQALTWNLASNA